MFCCQIIFLWLNNLLWGEKWGRNGFTFQISKDMEETRDDAGPAEQGPSNASWWHSDFIERFGSVSLGSQDETLSNTESPRSSDQDVLTSQKASQILWRTGVLSEPIPNGFYSVVPVRFVCSFIMYA